jgi:hypothetical protein
LESMKPEGVRLRMREIRRFVEADLCDLRQFLNTESRDWREPRSPSTSKKSFSPDRAADTLQQGTGIFWDWALTMVPGARIAPWCH